MEQGNLVFLTTHSNATLKTLPPYYRQMIKNWIEMTKTETHKTLTIEQILRQPIFFNPHITKSNNTLKPTENTKRNNILKLADIAIVFRPGFLKHEILNINKNELKNINTSLPPQWRSKIENESQNYDHNKANLTITVILNLTVNFQDLNQKTIYKIRIEKENTKTKTHYLKWNKILRNSMLHTTETEWEKLFDTIHKRRNNNKANEIKYKAIHLALPTNAIFKKRGYAADDLCPQCMKAPENLSHMLYSCEKAQPLIKYSVTLLNIIYPSNERFKNTFKLFLFGPSDKAHNCYIGNIIFDELLFQRYCNRMRAFYERTTYSRERLLREYESKVKNLISTEYEIAKENNTLGDLLNETKNIWNERGKLDLKLNVSRFLR